MAENESYDDQERRRRLLEERMSPEQREMLAVYRQHRPSSEWERRQQDRKQKKVKRKSGLFGFLRRAETYAVMLAVVPVVVFIGGMAALFALEQSLDMGAVMELSRDEELRGSVDPSQRGTLDGLDTVAWLYDNFLAILLAVAAFFWMCAGVVMVAAYGVRQRRRQRGSASRTTDRKDDREYTERSADRDDREHRAEHGRRRGDGD